MDGILPIEPQVPYDQLPAGESDPSSVQRAQDRMADPFEVRMRFTSQLQHLNASVNSSQKAAHYALKFRDMDEDLHSCILEQIEKVYKYPLVTVVAQWLRALEFHEQPCKHHVFHRTLVRYGPTRKPCRIRSNDATGYITRCRCSCPRRWIWRGQC